MTYLVLAVLSSTAISILMRVFDPQIKNNMVMFSANYLICEALSIFFLVYDKSILSGGADVSGAVLHGAGFAIGLGLVSGVMYLVSFVLLQLNIQKNGVILASTFMKLGVLVPVLMAVICFGEQWNGLQLAGLVLAVAAILIINGFPKKPENQEKPKSAGSKSMIWLVILLAAGGLTDSMSNIYDKIGMPAFKNHYLVCIFAAAIAASLVMVVVKRQRFTVRDFLCGVCIGIPNYFSSRFLLYSLSSVPAIVVYPFFNISAILLITVIGTTVFKEQLNRQKAVGLTLILVAIILLNR